VAYNKPLPTAHEKLPALLLFLAITAHAAALNGTYEKKASQGAYGVISLQKAGAKVKAEIFTWRNSPNAQTGSYYGEGTLEKNTAVLKSDENNKGCKVTLTLSGNQVKATFPDFLKGNAGK
jgi:hypothetical protein